MAGVEKDTTAPDGGNQPPGWERRCKRRRRSRGRAFAQIVARPDLRRFRVMVCEASPQGLSFLHDRVLEPGTVLGIQLGGGTGGASLIRSAVVVYATPLWGEWRIGCRVSPPFRPGELETL